MAYKIRTRQILGKWAWERAVSEEVQVVEGRRVVARFDLESEAQAWIARKLAETVPAQP